MKKALTTFAFLLVFAAFASAITIQKLEMAVEIDEAGLAHVTENYSLKFSLFSPEFEGFKKNKEENGSSLMAWMVDYDWFFPHFGGEPTRAISRSFVEFDERDNILTLDYFLKDKFAIVSSDEPRQTKWKISDNKLKSFEAGGLIVVPENTEIIFRLPSNAEVSKSQLSKQAKVEDSTVILSGISTNFVNLEYSMPKPIVSANPFDEVVKAARSYWVFLLAILLVLAGAAFAKRKEVSKRIEDYIIEHSELEAGEPEEELEFD